MKTNINTLFLLLAIATGAHAQGPMTPPPGAPAPVMKSLDQIESRTPISGVTVITSPGSYYLTGDITATGGNAITISCDSVALDLNGFTIRSSVANYVSSAILLSDQRTNIAISNGFIEGQVEKDGAGQFSGNGFGNGIYADANSGNVRISEISISGCRYAGIWVVPSGIGLASSVLIESCLVKNVGGRGIFSSTIRSSSAFNCTNSGISGDHVSGCVGQSVSSGSGIYAAVAENCSGYSASGIGIAADTATHCYGESITGAQGLLANGTATFCRGKRPGGVAISAAIAIGCTSASGTISSPQKHLGTP